LHHYQQSRYQQVLRVTCANLFPSFWELSFLALSVEKSLALTNLDIVVSKGSRYRFIEQIEQTLPFLLKRKTFLGLDELGQEFIEVSFVKNYYHSSGVKVLVG
jgi:hypothetical protein